MDSLIFYIIIREAVTSNAFEVVLKSSMSWLKKQMSHPFTDREGGSLAVFIIIRITSLAYTMTMLWFFAVTISANVTLFNTIDVCVTRHCFETDSIITNPSLEERDFPNNLPW